MAAEPAPRRWCSGLTAHGPRVSAAEPSTWQRVSSAYPAMEPSGASVTQDRPGIHAAGSARSASTMSAS